MTSFHLDKNVVCSIFNALQTPQTTAVIQLEQKHQIRQNKLGTAEYYVLKEIYLK